MGQTSKLGMSRIVKKRDKAFDQMEFNREYPGVAEALIDAKNEKQRHKLELRCKKKLYPLEIAAAPPKEGNREMRDVAVAKLVEKQVMPRRAIEQAALRLEKKSGKQAAEQYRNEKLGALDKALEECRAQMLAKYPDTDEPAQPQAVAAYKVAQNEAEQALAAFDAKCDADKKQVLEKLNKKLAGQSEKLQVSFDGTNNQLHEMSGTEAKEVGKDTVLSIKGNW